MIDSIFFYRLGIFFIFTFALLDREGIPEAGCHLHWQEESSWPKVQEGKFY
jgi:hypothetical protein